MTHSLFIPNTDIDYDALRQIFVYHDDGTLRWRETRSSRAAEGQVAGAPRMGSANYWVISIGPKQMSRSKLVWMYHYGYWCSPTLVIDHIDSDKQNDRIENLRMLTVSDNANARHGNTVTPLNANAPWFELKVSAMGIEITD